MCKYASVLAWVRGVQVCGCECIFESARVHKCMCVVCKSMCVSAHVRMVYDSLGCTRYIRS